MMKSIIIFFVILVAAAVNIWADADTAGAAAPPPVSYTGASLSAVIPGAGQIYQKRYYLGGFFLAAEAVTGIMTYYWFGEAKDRLDKFEIARDSASALRRAAARSGDSAEMSMAGLYGIHADRAEFEARRAKYMGYNMLAWTAGAHMFNFADALEAGGVKPRGAAKSPMKAGLLSAVPFSGFGQLYNVRPGKAGMMAMTQASLAVMASTEHHLMNFADGKYNQMRDSTTAQYEHRAEHLSYWKGRYDQAFSRRNTYLWITLFAYAYGIIDAVVDAHLSDYPERVKAGSDLSFGWSPQGGTGLTVSINF